MNAQQGVNHGLFADEGTVGPALPGGISTVAVEGRSTHAVQNHPTIFVLEQSGKLTCIPDYPPITNRFCERHVLTAWGLPSPRFDSAADTAKTESESKV